MRMPNPVCGLRYIGGMKQEVPIGHWGFLQELTDVRARDAATFLAFIEKVTTRQYPYFEALYGVSQSTFIININP